MNGEGAPDERLRHNSPAADRRRLYHGDLTPSQPPRLLIVLEFESLRPRVVKVVDTDGQERRLDNWIEAVPLLRELVRRATSPDEEGRAA
jgi:hypothetical protein